MMKSNFQKGIVSSFVLAILLLSVGQMRMISAAGPEIVTDGANGLALIADFHFKEGDEKVSTFKYFGTESSGFARNKPLSFKLEGIIGYDRPLLYQAINNYFEYGMSNRANVSDSDFNVDISFVRGGETYRSITYGDCQVKFYDVITYTDAEESYSYSTKWAYVDSIKFDCRGYEPHNPVLDAVMKAKSDKVTQDALKNLDKKLETQKQQEQTVAKYTIPMEMNEDFASNSMPSWLRHVANWAETDKISMQEYQNLIRYLVANNIL